MAKTSPIVVVFMILAVAISSSQSLDIKPMIALDMIENLLKSTANMRIASPEQNKKCFDEYTPKLSELSQAYKAEYDKCSETEESSKQSIINEVAPNIALITQWRNEVCSSYSNCQGSDTLPFFDCNKNASADAITKSYKIEKESKDRFEYVGMREKMVEYNSNVCIAKAKENYDLNTNKVYKQLQICLNAA